MAVHHMKFESPKEEIFVRDLTENDAALMARGIQNVYDIVRKCIRMGDNEGALKAMRDAHHSRLELEGWLKKRLSPWSPDETGSAS